MDGWAAGMAVVAVCYWAALLQGTARACAGGCALQANGHANRKGNGVHITRSSNCASRDQERTGPAGSAVLPSAQRSFALRAQRSPKAMPRASSGSISSPRCDRSAAAPWPSAGGAAGVSRRRLPPAVLGQNTAGWAEERSGAQAFIVCCSRLPSGSEADAAGMTMTCTATVLAHPARD